MSLLPLLLSYSQLGFFPAFWFFCAFVATLFFFGVVVGVVFGFIRSCVRWLFS
jgi:hypothetical protein